MTIINSMVDVWNLASSSLLQNKPKSTLNQLKNEKFSLGGYILKEVFENIKREGMG